MLPLGLSPGPIAFTRSGIEESVWTYSSETNGVVFKAFHYELVLGQGKMSGSSRFYTDYQTRELIQRLLKKLHPLHATIINGGSDGYRSPVDFNLDSC